jgi:hypothetical protein
MPANYQTLSTEDKNMSWDEHKACKERCRNNTNSSTAREENPYNNSDAKKGQNISVESNKAEGKDMHTERYHIKFDKSVIDEDIKIPIIVFFCFWWVASLSIILCNFMVDIPSNELPPQWLTIIAGITIACTLPKIFKTIIKGALSFLKRAFVIVKE